ncbi:MAG: ABC transporter permease [Alphaproteobacteria bacterium]|nr:ABC transporter permease [Alphaproteobacteria bacterium]
MRRPRTALLLLLPAVILIVVVLVLPVGWLIRFSLFEGQSGVQAAGGLTLEHYSRALTDSFFLGIFGRTILMALIITVLAVALGYPLAHFMWKAPARWRGPLTILALSPLLVSIVVSSYGWIVLLGNRGTINSLLMWAGITSTPLRLMYSEFAIVVGLTHIVLPFMVLSILAALERIDPLLAEAAATLGADARRTLWHITLPLALPGIGAGTTIVFSIAISAYVTPAVLGPSGPNFITTLIYQQFTMLFEWPFGAALAALLLAVAMTVVFLYMRLLSRAGALGAGRHDARAGGRAGAQA